MSNSNRVEEGDTSDSRAGRSDFSMLPQAVPERRGKMDPVADAVSVLWVALKG